MRKAMSVTEQLHILKQPIVEQCIAGGKSCSKVDIETPFTTPTMGCDDSLKHYCKTYAFPSAKWRIGNCNMADHLEIETKKDTKKVNPLKASKRGNK